LILAAGGKAHEFPGTLFVGGIGSCFVRAGVPYRAPALYAFRYDTRGKVRRSVGRQEVLDKPGWVWAAFVLLLATFVVLIFMQLQRPDAGPWGGEKALPPVKEVSHEPPPAAPEEEAPDYRPEY